MSTYERPANDRQPLFFRTTRCKNPLELFFKIQKITDSPYFNGASIELYFILGRCKLAWVLLILSLQRPPARLAILPFINCLFKQLSLSHRSFPMCVAFSVVFIQENKIHLMFFFKRYSRSTLVLRKNDQRWRIYETFAHRSRYIAYLALTSDSEF